MPNLHVVSPFGHDEGGRSYAAQTVGKSRPCQVTSWDRQSSAWQQGGSDRKPETSRELVEGGISQVLGGMDVASQHGRAHANMSSRACAGASWHG